MERPAPKCATKGTPLIAHFRGGSKGPKKTYFRIEKTYFRGSNWAQWGLKVLEEGPRRSNNPCVDPPLS